MDAVKLLGIFIALGCLKITSAESDLDSLHTDCQARVDQCRKPLVDHKTGNVKAEPDGGYCFYTDDQLDTLCRLGTEAMRCLENDVEAVCFEDSFDLRAVRNGTRLGTTGVCLNQTSDESYTCYVEASRCLCNFDGPDGEETYCSGFKPYHECIDRHVKACLEEPEWQQKAAMAERFTDAYSYLNCPEFGGCRGAMNCLHQSISTSVGRFVNWKGGAEVLFVWPDTDIPTVCRDVSFFGCLNSSTAACHIDQGDVTMDEIDRAMFRACTDVFSKMTSNGMCEGFLDCHKSFPLVPSQPDEKIFIYSSKEELNDTTFSTLLHFIASTTRTGFWCSWLQHNYQCVIENAEACNLTESVVYFGQKNLNALETMCVGAATAPPPRSRSGVSSSDSAKIFTAPLCLLSVSVLGTFFLQMGVADHIVSTL